MNHTLKSWRNLQEYLPYCKEWQLLNLCIATVQESNPHPDSRFDSSKIMIEESIIRSCNFLCPPPFLVPTAISRHNFFSHVSWFCVLINHTTTRKFGHSLMKPPKLVQSIVGLSLIVQIDQWHEQSVTLYIWDTTPYD
jgi:hypothetical protein